METPKQFLELQNEKTNFIKDQNLAYSKILTSTALITKQLNGVVAENTAKRAFSYNLDNQELLEAFPQFQEPIETINHILESKKVLIEKDDSSSIINNAWIILGHCYLVLGDFPNAFNCYTRVHYENLDDNSMFWYAYGIVCHHFENNSQAYFCFNKILDNVNINEFPFLSDLYFRFALLLRNQNDYTTSLKYLNRIIDNPPLGLHSHDIQLQISFELYEKNFLQ